MSTTRTIGIVGGMSPESTVAYYLRVVHAHQEAFGNHAYPRIVVASVSFQTYVDAMHAGRWDAITAGLQKEFEAVAAAGADFAVLATNTMHKVLPDIASPIPVLDITDAIAAHAREHEIGVVGLAGTRFVMNDGFYQRALERRGLGVITPLDDEQETIHRIIFEELISGRVEPDSERTFADICGRLVRRGAQSVLLACTELELLSRTLDVPFIDTTRVHAEAAWRMATAERGPATADREP